MDAQTCLKKMQLAGTLSLATVDENGAPQIRCVSAVHYESRAIYFFTARGKEMARQLMADGRVQTLVHTRFNEMIRMSGVATLPWIPSKFTGVTLFMPSSRILPTFIPVIRVISTLSLRSKTSCSTTLTWGFVLLSALSLP